jgi:hypothetical protein
MKTYSCFRWLSLVLLCIPFWLHAQNFITIQGRVIDATTHHVVVAASVQVKGTSVGIVTNGEGQFLLKIPIIYQHDSIHVSHLGYNPAVVSIDELASHSPKNLIRLDPAVYNLGAITVRSGNALELVQHAFGNTVTNYRKSPVQMTGFYREMIKKGNRYIAISEAVLNIIKAPYNSFTSDQATIYKGRGIVDHSQVDTLFMKFQGGITSALSIDMMKNPFVGGTPVDQIGAFYNFTYDTPAMINNRFNYVVDFDQKPETRGEILFRGKIYIDAETEAVSRVDFNMNVENRPDASQLFILKKPFGVKVDVASTHYEVNYKEQHNRWYFDYSSMEVKFKCKWAKHLFNSYFTVMGELAITDHSLDVTPIPSRDRVRWNDIVSDKVTNFKNDDFWESYNVIEPEKPIDQVIERISKQLKKEEAKEKKASKSE